MVKQYDVHAADAELQWGAALPFDSGDRVTSAAGAAAALVIAAQTAPNRPVVLTQIHCGYSATPTGGQIQVKDGSTVVFQQSLAGTGPFEFNFSPPRAGTPGSALTITLAGGGGAVVGELDVNAHTLA